MKIFHSGVFSIGANNGLALKMCQATPYNNGLQKKNYIYCSTYLKKPYKNLLVQVHIHTIYFQIRTDSSVEVDKAVEFFWVAIETQIEEEKIYFDIQIFENILYATQGNWNLIGDQFWSMHIHVSMVITKQNWLACWYGIWITITWILPPWGL